MALPDMFLQELISRNPITDVVSSYVRLRQRGRTAVGLCPFHGEKTPSFTVYPETSSFYCFGCGAGGDTITFIKKIENLSYIDAVRFLADRCGMKMPDDKTDDAVSRLRMRILEANRDAARFFHRMLYSPEGREGLEYFYKRGYTDKTIRRFGLGYAPGNNSLLHEMRRMGYKDDELTAAFLAARSKRNNQLYDIFQRRVIIPIIDIRGNVIAFGGRVLDDSKPKYINTSDTLVFKKSNGLFALNFAKASKEGSIILCEGYMDVISLHQAGFQNAVAALGTSFTKEHALLLSRYANEAILIFDADSAGQKGAQRAISYLRQSGIHIRVVTIPDGKDPDEFIKKYGPERFKLLLEKSANDIEYQLIQLGKKHSLETSDGRVSYLREAAILLSRLNSSIERDVYAGKLADELNVSKSALLDQIERYRNVAVKNMKKAELSQAIRQNEGVIRKVNPEAASNIRASRAEEGLLGLLILNPDYIPAVSKRLQPDDIVTGFNKNLYIKLLERHKNGQMIDLSFLASDYQEDEMSYISRMVQNARENPGTHEQALEYADIIISEKKMLLYSNPENLPEDKLREMLEFIRSQKK
ncbi:MAG TPA: DNA primase [Clostridiales bacterium]|nr:DNA primase [Clostridiales bacterium]